MITNMPNQLEEELKERLHTKRLEKCEKSLTGGCISGGYCYTIDDDENIFVKTNASQYAASMFHGEQESLKQIISTKTIKAPKPLTVIHDYDDTHKSAIAMQFFDLRPLTADGARNLGHDLAKLHDYNNKVLRFNKRASRWIGGKPPSVKAALDSKSNTEEESEDKQKEEEEEENRFAKHSMRTRGTRFGESDQRPSREVGTVDFAERFLPEPDTEEVKQFGFDVSTSCGLIPQVNEWTDDWVSFYARHRLDKSIRSLLSDHGDRDLSQEWSHLQLKVDKFFADFPNSNGPEEDKIVPALLHGDLWSGNVAQLDESYTAIVYDPSSFYGHSEYDFGIARMFGGIPKAFEVSYFEILPKKKLFEKRNKLYQLFHHVNHWDHFGSGYRASSLRLLKDLNSLV